MQDHFEERQRPLGADKGNRMKASFVTSALIGPACLNPQRYTRPFLPLFFTLFLTACASGYKEFYKQALGTTPEVIAAMRVAPPPATPIIEHAEPGDSMTTILDAYAKRGYIMIGNSMFTSGYPEAEDSAVRQAQDVGADLVLILYPRYAGSMTSMTPVTTLTRTPKGSSRANDITTYVPVTIPLADYVAVYFVKQR